jgi:hypothetical protein
MTRLGPMHRSFTTQLVIACALLCLHCAADDGEAASTGAGGVAAVASAPESDAVRADLSDAGARPHGGDKGLFVPAKKWNTSTISVCWSSDSDATAQQRKTVADMVQETWAGYANISFDWKENGDWRVCDRADAPTDVIIFQDSVNVGFRSCAETGTNNRTDDSGALCFGADWSCDAKTQKCGGKHRYADVVLEPQGRESFIHEFGHVLAIWHEHSRIDTTDCASADDYHANNPQWVTVGDYDPQSVMNYCRTPRVDITETDILTVQTMYGPRPSHVRWQATSWLPSTITGVATDGWGSVATTILENVDLSGTSGTSTGTLAAGDWYDIDVVPQPAHLVCLSTRPRADYVRGKPVHVLPNDFARGNIGVMCFDPASLAASVLG